MCDMTTFSNITWEGRTWLDIAHPFTPTPENQIKLGKTSASCNKSTSIRFCCYHVCADSKCSVVNSSSTRSWDSRCRLLLNEVESYKADIFCFQDVDHFSDWWQPQLSNLGYDSVWKRCTSLRDPRPEGVLIAFNRKLFQLFKTVPVELNSAAEFEDNPLLRDRIRSDDVGLIVFLQPLAVDSFSSAVCVGCAMFSDRANDSDVRLIQSKYFARSIERANMEFQLPVLLGLSLQDAPSSGAYHLFSTGRVPVNPKRPGKPARVIGNPTCRGSVRLSWYPPARGKADPEFSTYRIAWCPGGSLEMGFTLEREVAAEDCFQYTTITNKRGNKKVIQTEELSFVIAGLSSGVAYEFRVAAVNALGLGEWSDTTTPITMPTATKDIAVPRFKHLKGQVKIIEMRESHQMKASDQNANKLVRKSGDMTNLSPRDLLDTPVSDIPRARVLPDTVNPREGWSSTLLGACSAAVTRDTNTEDAVRKSLIRPGGRFLKGVSDYSSGRKAKLPGGGGAFSDDDDDDDDEEEGGDSGNSSPAPVFSDDEDEDEEYNTANDGFETADTGSMGESSRQGFPPPSSIAAGSRNRPNNTDHKSEGTSYVSTAETSSRHRGGDGGSYSSFELGTIPSTVVGSPGPHHYNDESIQEGNDISTVDVTTLMEGQGVVEGGDDVGSSSITAAGADGMMDKGDTILDCRDVVEHLGSSNPRQVHGMRLRSAYDWFSSAGEPVFTALQPADTSSAGGGASCKDYIFYSGSSLRLSKVCSMPTAAQLRGEDPRQPPTIEDALWQRPSHLMRRCFNTVNIEAVVGSTGGKSRDNSSNNNNNVDESNARDDARTIAMDEQVRAMKRRLRTALGKSMTVGQLQESEQQQQHKQSHINSEASQSQSQSRHASQQPQQSHPQGEQQVPSGYFYGGHWLPYSMENPYRLHHWLPNESFGSTHVALCAEFQINKEALAAEWN